MSCRASSEAGASRGWASLSLCPDQQKAVTDGRRSRVRPGRAPPIRPRQLLDVKSCLCLGDEPRETPTPRNSRERGAYANPPRKAIHDMNARHRILALTSIGALALLPAAAIASGGGGEATAPSESAQYSGHDTTRTGNSMGAMVFYVAGRTVRLEYLAACGQFTTPRLQLGKGGSFHYKAKFSNGYGINLTGQLKGTHMSGHVQTKGPGRGCTLGTLRWSAEKN